MSYIAGIAAMNYYEELGVGRDARVKEIRQAYKTLARLLHPDGQSDKRLKAMAELQMKRLNEILETLADPERRRKYDAELAGVRTLAIAPLPGNQRAGRPRPGKPRGPQAVESEVSRASEWVQAAARHWFWVLIAGTCVSTAVVWWTMPSEGSPADVVRAAPTASAIQLPVGTEATPPNKPQGHESAPDVGKVGQERHPAQAVVDRAAAVWPMEPPVLEPAASTRVPLDGVAADRNEDPVFGHDLDADRRTGNPPQVDNLSHVSPFSGNWLYTPQAGESRDQEAYQAVYVELLLAEERGDLVGSYRAKYKVTDKAISPEVVLRVRGRSPSGKSARADWTSVKGAKGVLEMTLQSPGAMSVAWWTTEFGPQPELSSGSAVLVRQQSQ